MNTRTLALAGTAVLMGLLVMAGRGTKDVGSSPPAVSRAAETAPEPAAPPAPRSGPETRIQALLNSARDGDVTAYLDSFAGPLRDRLGREAAERGRDTFAADLRAASRARKSHAVFAPEADGDAAARVTVEAVYPDRNERQTYRMERSGDAWKVTAVDTVRSVQPAAKFGSPAGYVAPEGPPVPATGVVVETGDEPAPR